MWSPDGKPIARGADRNGQWAIYTMKPHGTGGAKLVDAAVVPLWFLEEMAWRP